jgi:O-antigen/teichoic acid export membrane protein
MAPFALAGTGVWAVVGVVGLAAGAADWFLWTAFAGVLVGLALLGLMLVHDRGRNRRGRQTGSTSLSS